MFYTKPEIGLKAVYSNRSLKRTLEIFAGVSNIPRGHLGIPFNLFCF